MTTPNVLYAFEVDDLDAPGDSILSRGEPVPGVGAKCLLIPSSSGNQLYLIDKIWEVTACAPSDEPGWDHELTVSGLAVLNPTPWYDIIEHLLIEGLPTVVGASGGDSSSSGFYIGAVRISHGPTIEAIFQLLGIS